MRFHYASTVELTETIFGQLSFILQLFHCGILVKLIHHLPYFAVIDRRTVLKIVIDSWTAPFHNQSLLTLYFISVITSDSIFTFISINHRSTDSWSDSTFSAFSLQSMCHAWRIKVLFPISWFQLSNTADHLFPGESHSRITE